MIEKIRWIYNTNTVSEMEEKYDSWAECYEADLKYPYKKFCFDAAKHLAEFLPDPESLILDIGCGTGLVGEALAASGYSRLTGFDISQKMLQVAEEKDVYSHLVKGDVQEIESLCGSHAFDGAICVGTFTHGHLRPTALGSVLRPLKTGGVIGFTVKAELFLSNSEFSHMIDTLEWDLLDRRDLVLSGGGWENLLVYSWIFKKR